MTTTHPAPAATATLDGTVLARSIRATTAIRAAELTDAGHPPRLAVVLATDDESSAWYVRSIARTANKVGISCGITDLGSDCGPEDIRAALRTLSGDPTVHGIILQTPLPDGAHLEDLAGCIEPSKDVDGANPRSLGRLTAGLPAYAPATAAAVLELLDHHEIALAGRSCVVVGRSNVVGKPVAQLLLQRDATVTICHRHTPALTEFTPTADVLVIAVGRPGLITAEHVGDGSIVIDVGTNPTIDGGIVGDVDEPAVSERTTWLTPVPGGVGPVTTALLLRHTTQAASSHGQPHSSDPGAPVPHASSGERT